MQAQLIKGVVAARFDKYGPAFKLEGDEETVYAQDKKLLPSFEGVQKGAEVEIMANGKWVHSVKVVSQGEAPSKPPRTQGTYTPASNTPYQSSEKDAQIARSVAVKLGFDNPIISDMIQKGSAEEVIQHGKDLTKLFERYLLTGSFDPKELA